MIKLIKRAKVYEPEYIGKKDLLILDGKIACIDDNIKISCSSLQIEEINAEGKVLIPGLIDSHVHIIGGGGEGGFKTRTPEIKLTDITKGGVTTVIGCLGTDGISRSMHSLLAKARGLEEEGITTFIYSGSYRIPPTTITGEVIKDIISIDKVIGVGEIAISDHRSSQPVIEDIKKLAADVRLGGILSGKAGIINIHLGDGRRMIDMLFDIADSTEIPMTQFLPTHMNRNPYLFQEAIRYAKAGGYVDFTTSSDPVFWEEGETKTSKALKACLEAGVPKDRITFSSDGQGSLPMFNENKEFIGLRVGQVTSLFDEIRAAVLEEHIPVETAVRVATSNPAAILKLKGKGRIKEGYDADLVLIDEDSFEIETVIAKGQIMLQDRKIMIFGTFEE